MDSRTKKILILLTVASGLLISAYLIAYTLSESPEKDRSQYLVPKEGIEQDMWTRKIATEEMNDSKKFTNGYDGYSIVIPSNWVTTTPEILDPEMDGLIMKFYQKENALEENDSLHLPIDNVLLDNVLMIYPFDNEKRLSLLDWTARSEEIKEFLVGTSNRTYEEVSVGEMTAYKISSEVGWFITDYDAPSTAVEIDYVFQNRKTKKTYVVSCLSTGENSQESILSCEQLVLSFEIL